MELVKHTKKVLNGKIVQLTFTDDTITMVDPICHTQTTWDYFIKVEETGSGILLTTVSTFSIFLEKTNFQDIEDIQTIIAKIKKHQSKTTPT